MKITYKPGFFRTLEDQLEMDHIIETIRNGNHKPKPVKPDGMSQEDFILSLQAPSTKRVLLMTDEEAEAHRHRPMISMEDAAADKEAYAAYMKDPNDANYRKMIGARELTPDEINLEERRRRSSKNTLGQSELSATSEIKRERAIEGFIRTPPAKVTKAEVEARAINLVEYKSEPIKEEWREIPWYQALIHFLKGNKIKVDPKK